MEQFGETVPLLAVLPFAVMLLGIAVLPLAAHHWWESNRNRAIFTAVVSVPMVIYLAVLEATPTTNAAILLLGAVLANLVGTTGASMLLIRVLLRTNKQRKHVTHIPFFFILIVSACRSRGP
jgi:hypothetical protein